MMDLVDGLLVFCGFDVMDLDLDFPRRSTGFRLCVGFGV